MAGNTMATIEPRLMHLLNVNDSREHLPSIHSTLGAPKYNHDARLLLPPIDLGATEHAGIGASKQLPPQPSPSAQPPNPASVPASSFSSDPGADIAWSARAHPADAPSLHAGRLDDAAASIIGKRPRVLPHADELIQLPQPLKKQKSSQQVGSRGQVFPPIINGLHEPPPNAAVFPPIASADFDNEEVLNRTSLPGEFSTPTNGGGSASGRNNSANSLLFDGASPAAAAFAATSEGDLPPSRSLRSAESISSLASSSTVARRSSRKPLTPGTPHSPDTPETATTPSASLKPSKRASKPRRRWTDEETDQLLIGVSRHGLGKWTAILEDPEFSFCNRTAGDLKDRFRTCCPDELRGNSSSHADPPASSSPDAAVRSSSDPALAPRRLRPKASLSLENILIESDELPHQQQQGPGGDGAGGGGGGAASSDPPKQRKRKVHRKNMEDMVKLGIRGPFKKSHRRERRPFTEQDDREILEGLQLYGPAWTKIHRDEKFHLTSRQPTDLRDRVRNKYPEIYANIEKGVMPDSLCRMADTAPAAAAPAEGSGSGSSSGSGSRNRRPSSGPAVPTSPLEPRTTNSSTSSRTRRRSPFPAAALAPAGSGGAPGPSPSHHHGPPLPSLPPAAARDDLGRRPPTASSLPLHGEPLELHHDASVYDLGDHNSSSFLGSVGEMGISRLLLDDPQMPTYSL